MGLRIRTTCGVWIGVTTSCARRRHQIGSPSISDRSHCIHSVYHNAYKKVYIIFTERSGSRGSSGASCSAWIRSMGITGTSRRAVRGRPMSHSVIFETRRSGVFRITRQ